MFSFNCSIHSVNRSYLNFIISFELSHIQHFCQENADWIKLINGSHPCSVNGALPKITFFVYSTGCQSYLSALNQILKMRSAGAKKYSLHASRCNLGTIYIQTIHRSNSLIKCAWYFYFALTKYIWNRLRHKIAWSTILNRHTIGY